MNQRCDPHSGSRLRWRHLVGDLGKDEMVAGCFPRKRSWRVVISLLRGEEAGFLE